MAAPEYRSAQEYRHRMEKAAERAHNRKRNRRIPAPDGSADLRQTAVDMLATVGLVIFVFSLFMGWSVLLLGWAAKPGESDGREAPHTLGLAENSPDRQNGLTAPSPAFGIDDGIAHPHDAEVDAIIP